MCFANDAEPPPPPTDARTPAGEPVTLTAADGTELRAWSAHAPTPTGAGVVILPDIRGLFPYYQRLAEHFAAIGADAIAIDYFGRTLGTGPRAHDFDPMPYIKQTRYEQVNLDIAAGVAALREQHRVQAIFTVGFCFGGSYSFTSAADATLGLAGVIGFYGGMWPRSPGAPSVLTQAPHATVPVLGLFGGADESIPPANIAEFQAGLQAAQVPHHIEVYPGAPHSFFDRSHGQHEQACADAWQQMRDFITANTPAG